MPAEMMTHLKTVWCAGQQLRITKDGTPPDTAGKKPAGPRHPGSRPAPFNAGKKAFGPKKDFGDRKPFKPKPHRKGPRPE
jgi:ATP-dependent RNA helicase DeaD